MTTESIPIDERTVDTTDRRLLDRFVAHHRAICGRKIPASMHLDQSDAYLNLYECPRCHAAVGLSNKRRGDEPEHITLIASEAMAEAAEKDRQPSNASGEKETA